MMIRLKQLFLTPVALAAHKEQVMDEFKFPDEIEQKTSAKDNDFEIEVID